MRRLLVQLDGDRLPSLFDRIVGYDAGAEDVLSYGGVEEPEVRGLVHGAIFTRGPKELASTALFVGGSDAGHAERMLAAARATFFGPFRVSVMLDPNGANTTAAAAVLKVVQALGGDVTTRRVVVLAGTGPVGTRVAGLLGRLGASVRITSRGRAHADAAAAEVAARFGVAAEPLVVGGPAEAAAALEGADVAIATGPAGVRLLARADWAGRPGLRVVADVNAVPPSGIEGVEPVDDGVERDGPIAFGALGIGRLKMKIHKTCIARLFERNDLVLDAETIYDLAAGL
ncbi:MAG TPA: NAD(P)-dependent methylenetetrahydromethanopterin dehydrogenase [Longimicrobiales bacterium]|nr:NAD(P)-dependent methylenetetrahydromethanopterin dehydrogenase [Longimicrobiales bacterium]